MNPMPPSGETRSSPRHFTPSTTTPTPTSTASGSSSSLLSSSSSSSSSASPSSSSLEKSAVVCPDYLSGSCVNGSQCPLYHPPIMSPQHAFTAYQSSSSSPLTHHHHHHHHPLPLHNQNTSYPHNQMLADHLSMGFANMGFNNINLNHLLSHAQQHPSTTNSFLHHFHLQSSSFSQQDNQQLQQDLSSSSPPSSSPPASNVHDFSQPAGGSTSPVAASATSSSFDQLYSTSSASSSPLVSSSGVNTPSDALSHMVQQPSASSGNGSRSGSGSGASAFFPSRPGALHHHQHHPHQQQQQALHTDAYGNIYVTTMPSSTVFPLQSPLPSPHAHSSGVDGGMSHLHIDTQLSNHTTAAAGAFPYQFAPFYYPSISPTMAFHPHAHHQAATGVHPPPPPLHASHHPQQLPHPLHRVSSHPLLAGPQLHHSHHSPLLHHNMSQSYSSRSLSSSSSSPSSSGSSSSSSSPSGGHPGHVYSSSRGDHQGQQARDVCRDYKHGVCSRGDRCRYLHIREVCADFLRGKCDRDKCKYSHDKSHGPQCVDFMRGVCHRGETCKFYHGRPPVCRDFQRSMCIRGDRCKYSHVTTTQNSITADSRYYPMNTAALTSAKNVEADTGMMTSNSVSESPLSETESFERKDTLENETEEARGSPREGSVILNHVSAASSSSSGEAVPMVVSASSSNSTSPYSSQATSPREASLSPSSGDATATTPSLAPMPPSVDVSSSQLPVLAPHPRMPISATRRSSLRSEDF